MKKSYNPQLHQDNFKKTLAYLQKKKKILFLTTSNRWVGDKEIPKSSQLAHLLAAELSGKATVLDVAKMKIFPCEGNVSTAKGNSCGVKKALLKDKNKNPSGQHRCWASINNPTDELWKISKELFNSDCVVFFSSVRWGQLNSFYQKLIERLTWIENRQSTYHEKNPVKNIEAGLIVVGQNWHGKEALKLETKVLKWFGFKVKNQLCWNWQFTNLNDETNQSYIKGAKKFAETFGKIKLAEK